MRPLIRLFVFIIVIAMLVSASSCLSPFLVLRKAESKSEANAVGSSNAQMSVKTIKPGVLTVGTNPDLEPLSYYDENGKLTGFDVDLITEICKTLDLECVIITMDYEGLLTSCADNQVDCVIGGILYSDDRAEFLFYSHYLTETIDGETMDYCIYAKSYNLTNTFSAILETYKENGVYNAIYQRYFSPYGST